MLSNPVYIKLKERICSKLNIQPQDIFCFQDEKGALFEFNHPLETIDNIVAIVQETFKNFKNINFEVNAKKSNDGSYDLNATINELLYSSEIYSQSAGHFIINLNKYLMTQK